MVFLKYFVLLCFLVISTETYSNETTSHKPTAAETWGIGLGFVTLISICSCVGIVLMVFLNQSLYEKCLTCFVGLGVGSLCGSAIFHLIPEAFGFGHGHGHSEDHHDEDHNDHHDEDQNDHHDDHDMGSTAYFRLCWLIIAGIFMFFLTDKLLKLFFAYRKKRASPNTSSSSTNSHAETSMNTSDSSVSIVSYNRTDTDAVHPAANEDAVKAHAWCEHDHLTLKEGDSVIKTVAWMIIFGDGLHNFLDGLSIGAAFAVSVISGISVSIAIFCEELPHELGDVAILIKAGMSLKQAMIYNLLSAATCYIGFIIGVVLGELEMAVYIFAFAGGMFLYISFACMMPEMNELTEKKLKTASSVVPAAKVMALQIVGLGVGLLIMFLLSYYNLETHF